MASQLTGTGTFIYEEDWAETLQAQLDEPNKWKEFCDVVYTKFYTLNNPYHTDATVQTNERGTPYTYQLVSQTNQSVNINVSRILPQFIDRATLSQSTYASQMEMAKRQGVLIDEAIESYIYQLHASYTDFTNVDIGGGAGSITVSASNVDDVCRGLLREIRQANGQSLLERHGAFIVWNPSDFEKVEAFAQANGFNSADKYLKDGAGAVRGVHYFGIDHYTSNLLVATHALGGVKKSIFLGINTDLYGQVMIDDKDPSQRSGVSVVSRVDFGVTVWNNLIPVIFDIAVA